MDTKLHVVTCGIPGQLRELEGLIQDCMAQGYWLVINNAHLIEDWSQDFLKLLQVKKNPIPEISFQSFWGLLPEAFWPTGIVIACVCLCVNFCLSER